jgi:hypothetical protein
MNDPADEDVWRAWISAVGSVAPIGPALRTALGKRSWRFHSGDSFRIPVHEDQIAEASARHRAVARRMLGAGSRCIVYCTSWNEPLPPGRWTRTAIPAHFVRDEWLADWLEGSRVHTTETEDIERLLEEVALPIVMGRTGVCIGALSTETGIVYCPYDGGADVVMRSGADANDARLEFLRWAAPPAAPRRET